VAQKSLKAQIVKYGIVSLASAGVFISGAYLLNRYLTVRQAVDYEGNKLVASARKQAEEILPGLLVPEEYGSINLQLKKIRTTEDLLDATFNKSPDAALAVLLKCPKTSERTHVCANYLDNQIVTATEVGLPGQAMGYLVKRKHLTNPRQDGIMMLSLAALFCGIALVFLGLIASVLIFIDRHLRKPLLNLSERLTPILDGVAGAELAHFDVTELQSVADQVEQLVRKYEEKKATAATGEFAAQVAHDIRSPLAALDSVLKDLSQLPEEKRVLMRSAVGRIRDIANNLIEKNRAAARVASGSDANEAPAEAGATHLLSSLVDSLVTEKRLQFRSQIGVEIDSRIDPSSYGLFSASPPSEFKRVISNLINNAVEALPGKGSVTVRLASNGDSTEIRVRDNGKGIPADVLPRLGQRGETHGKPGGSGLGLYHAKTSVESWGGGLAIDSEPGKGTTVTIHLPRARPPEWFVSGLAISPGTAIVVLDDDTSIHQVWQGRFESAQIKNHGVEVLHFSTPAELRSWIQTDARAAENTLYLLDYELLGYRETGLSLAEELGIGAHTILVTSRFEEKGILADALRLKARLIPKSLAGFVPIRIEEKKAPERFDAILIDDDPLARMTWKMAASQSGKKFRSFSTVAEFLEEAPAVKRETPVYVDAELADGVNGAQESIKFIDLGFKEIYLATGHEAARFAAYKHLRGVVGKDPPWSENSTPTLSRLPKP
jgi:signal transduction histidine kinase